MTSVPSTDANLPDLVFTVHEVHLEEATLRRVQRERKPHLWVSVDPLGLADELGLGELCSRRVRAVHPTVGVSLQARVPVEPTEMIWAPIIEALRSEEEQDSDVYFVLKAGEAPDHSDPGDGSGATAGGGSDERGCLELGAAHVNLEELLRRGHEPQRERLPIYAEDGVTSPGWLSVSVRSLSAMRFARARMSAGDGGSRLGISVAIDDLHLSATAILRLEELLRGRKVPPAAHS